MHRETENDASEAELKGDGRDKGDEVEKDGKELR